MKAIVLLSGGLDSTTCLGLAIDKFGVENVHAVTVTYGQKHSKEIDCAKKVCAHYEVPFHMVDLTQIFEGANCSLLSSSDEEIPDGTYAEQIYDKGVSTYVPFRNGLMVSAIASKALSIDGDANWAVILGVHSDDTAGEAYPDCSQEFVDAMARAVTIGTYGQVDVSAPFVNARKSDIVKKGLELGVPYELTWSCYRGGDKQCGTCATCLDRKKAFEANGVSDPVPYEQ